MTAAGGTRWAQGRRIALISVVASAALAAGNIVVGLIAGSTSVTAAGFEFAGDVFASAVVFLGMLFGARPADENHPYGHGRIEIVAGLLVGTIIAGGGAGICYRSLQKVYEVHPPPAAWSAWPLVVAVAVKALLSTAKFRIGRRLQSASLLSDAWNDAVDILSALAALAALGLTLADPARFLAADHFGGFAIGLLVVITGGRVVRDTSLELMDTMPDPELLNEVRAAAEEVDGVLGVEKCRARKTGLQYHVDLHVEVAPTISVAEGHRIGGRVRSRIRERVPSVADVLVHVEPGSG